MPRRALSPAGLLAEFSGLIDLKVTASDGTLSVTDTFTLTITPTNDAPVVAAPIADQHMAEDTQWTFQVPVGTFDDIDSTGLTYTAILANGATPAVLAHVRCVDPHVLWHAAAGLQRFSGS